MLLRKLNLRTIWKELLVVCSVLLFSSAFYFHIYNLHEPELLTSGEDVWFQGDMPRITENMVDRFAWGHNRLKVHPLLSLQTFPPTYALKKLGLSDYQSIQVVSVVIASLWGLTLYTLFRIFGCGKIDAVLLLMLAWSSAATIFWLPTPESYALGSISIMFALMLAIVASKKQVASWVYVVISGFSFSVTVTNWMAGILATYTTQPKKRATFITLAALLLVTALWVVEKQIFPAAGFFIGDDEEVNYMYLPYLQRITSVLLNIISHTAVTPEILTLPNYHVFGEGGFNWIMVSIQDAGLGSATIAGKIATILWGILLGLGLWSLLKTSQLRAYKITLIFTLLGQMALHILYGEETFLYSLHFLPLLLGVIAFSLFQPIRPVAIILMLLAIPLMMLNNWQQFIVTKDITVSPRNEVLNHIKNRPNDVWSIYDSHAILAIPGSLESDKAYIEPGGSFSPKVGSFGLSVWMLGKQHELIQSSDTIPASKTKQSLMWPQDSTLPSMVTSTPYYTSISSIQSNSRMSYDIQLPKKSTLTPAVVIRSVGPAGAPIFSLRWDQQRLLVNEKWQLTFDPMPKHVSLGEEGTHPWHATSPPATTIRSQQGWAFANVIFDASQPIKVRMEALNNVTSYLLPAETIGSHATFNLPDQRFSDSLNAQIAHLMMGIVKDETRPGDPTNYPLNWQRDGAYILVALARAGQLYESEVLSKAFAERDFFGGFGAEADAPGLSLWALNQVANKLNNFSYDAFLWPHIRRKAGLIEYMMTTKVPMYQPFTGEVVPQHIADHEKHLVAEPAKDGLIIGRMDHHRPLLFVNAVSYLGLLEAANFADRFGKYDDQAHWLRLAEQLKNAWEKAFTPNNENERNYISALWPTWIAENHTPLLSSRLEQRWQEQHDENNQFKSKPLWTYFNVAETHQWLYLGDTKRVWSTLEWFWQHQNSPNLYTWWEGDSEENSFGIWQNVRGWVKPKSVNPHYWTAAEMALLQMDMLAYQDNAQPRPTIVIGAGIPLEWLSKPMDVSNLRVGKYLVDWHWKNNVMEVTVTGEKPVEIQLAKHFPSSTKLQVKYQ